MSKSYDGIDAVELGFALRRLREAREMTPQAVAAFIGSNTVSLFAFERGKPALGRKINKLPALFDCQSLQEILDKANALPLEIDRIKLGLALHRLREARGLSQQEVGDIIGVPQWTVSNFEHGKVKFDRYNSNGFLVLFGCQSLQEILDKANALPPEINPVELGVALHRLREARGLSQQEVGDAIEISSASVSQFELGKTTPNRENANKLLALFGCQSLQEMVEKANALTRVGGGKAGFTATETKRRRGDNDAHGRGK